jgi:UDP-2-acetamido-3-amino-2,3-dideoxy-glucuronate N-acetyltransferase
MFPELENKSYFVHPSSFVDASAEIGEGTKVWHFCHIMGGAKIGKRCSFGQNVFIANGVEIGNDVKVQNNVSIYEGVKCEDFVFIGPSVVFTNVFNPRSGVARKDQYRQTLLGKGVSIGANATLVCGIKLGKFAFVGAGAVVTKSFGDYALVYGNPAIQKGWMSEYGHPLTFDLHNRAICLESGEIYLKTEKDIVTKENG